MDPVTIAVTIALANLFTTGISLLTRQKKSDDSDHQIEVKLPDGSVINIDDRTDKASLERKISDIAGKAATKK